MPREKLDRVPFTFRLDDDTYAKAKAIAKMEERVTNSQLEYWIKKCVAEYEKEHGAILLSDE